jgi:hypothetical protein
MNQHQDPFKVSFLERLSGWSGWENLYEHRNKLFAGVIIFLAVIFGFFSMLSRYTASSATSIIKAEKIVEKLRNPTTTPEEPSSTTSYSDLLDRLEAIVPTKGDLAKRFSGVIAQEEVLQKLPLNDNRWQTAHNVLISDALSAYEKILTITKATHESHFEEALTTIDELSKKEEVQKSAVFYSYLLLQKASILFEQKKNNKQIIDELHDLISKNEDVQVIFDRACTNGNIALLEFLQID